MTASTLTAVFAERALLPDGWAERVRLDIDAAGRIASVQAGGSPQGAQIAAGPVVPAMPNLHSHAFQRAMAGLAEISGAGEDSFWTWREEMYRTVGLLSPEDVEAIAAKLYVELLKGGYGAVAEFHYLHHAPGGTAYADPAELSRRILKAASDTGIGLTLLPVFYAHGNFGGVPAAPGQRRFLHEVDAFADLLERLGPHCTAAKARLGVAIHSLRAATEGEMRAVLSAAPAAGPIHIHAAEQMKEVEDSLAFSGRRPVDWLLDEMEVDARWCLIHATHMTEGETQRLARSGAVAGLCPATEANLGDGIFPAVAYRGAGGCFGIGTDSHVATGVAEEVRLLEYGQRLRDRRRNRLADGPHRSVGRDVFAAALAGGAQALGQPLGTLAPGATASLVVLDGSDPFVAAARGDAVIDRWLFALGDRAVRDVMVAGAWVIRQGRHALEEAIDAAFLAVLERLRR
ncbi:MAG TPA: formimidoylglutamate deiminase [Xanthobacteraceae bacterium]|nr:formimidoylglutamate deiminase [Xanthobacteraceae bacterium]